MYKFLVGLCCAAAAATACLLYQPGSGPRHTRKLAVKEQTEARARRQWMMTRNPATGKVPDNIRNLELQFARSIPSRQAYTMAGKGTSYPLSWRPRGPVNRGGRTRALALDVTNQNIVLAGGQTNGMWKSLNGGQTWKRTTALSAHPSVTCVAQDQRAGKTGTWYYGSGEFESSAAGGDYANYNGDGIFKSVDGGDTWTVLPSTANGQPQTQYTFSVIWNIVCDPVTAGSDVVYAATGGSIQRSADGGATWANVLESANATYTDIAITKTGVLYATLDGDHNGIFRSADGLNWAKIIPNNFPSVNRRIVIGVAPSNQNTVYFFGETPGSGKNLGGEEHSLFKYEYLSGDGSGAGGTWTNRSDNIPAFGGDAGDYSSQNSYDMFITVKPDNPDVVFLGGTNLYRSTDGFASAGNTAWIGGYATVNDVSDYQNHHPDNHALVFTPANPRIALSAHDGGISRTTDCMAGAVAWQDLNTGYVTSQFYGIAIDQNKAGSPMIVGGLQDNGSYGTWSPDYATPWDAVGDGDGGYAAVADSNTFFVSLQEGGITRYSKKDTLGDLAPPPGATGMLFVTPYALYGADMKIMFYAAGGDLWRIRNAVTGTKDNWEKLDPLSSGDNISAIATGTANPAERLYFGTDNGKLYQALNFFDRPFFVQRKIITGTNFPAGAYISCIAVDPQNGDHVYVVFSNYGVPSVFASNDGGTSWTNVSGNLEQHPDGSGNGPSCRWLTVLPRPNGRAVFFVGTSTGLYSTENLDGANTVWLQEGADVIGNLVVTMVASRQADDQVVAATHAGGVFSATYKAAVEDGPQTMQGIMVQNYPEPFAGSTTVRYDLINAQAVEITVCDITGRRVQTLVKGWQPEGAHSVEFRPGNLPDGKYMVTITAGKHHQTKLITLAR